jgi:hypothetical protein
MIRKNSIILLFRLNMAENLRAYLILLLVLTGLLSIPLMLAFTMTLNSATVQVQQFFFFFGLGIGAAVVSSMQFGSLGRKSSSIQNILLPVSVWERIIVAIIISLPLYLLAYLLVYACADFMACHIKALFDFNEIQSYLPKYENIKGFIETFTSIKTIVFALSAHLSIQSFFLFASAYFKKHSFAFGALYYILFSVLMGVVAIFLSIKTYADGLYENGLRINALQIGEAGSIYNNGFLDKVGNNILLHALVGISLALLWYLVAAMVLKDKEARS